MALSEAAADRRRVRDRQYHRDNLAARHEYHRAWQSTSRGRLQNKLYVAQWRNRRRPTETLERTIAALITEIEKGG